MFEFGFWIVFSQTRLKREKMMEVVIVALAATIGNLLMGWDSSTIAGLYWTVYFCISSFSLIMLSLVIFQ